MGTFSASLRSVGDVKTLSATVELSDGRLSIVAGSTEIGSWLLSDVRLEEIPTGYRMAAEGEQVLIELKDVESFAAELASGNKKRGRFSRKKQDLPKRPEPMEDASVAPAHVAPAHKHEQPAPTVEPPASSPAETKSTGLTGKGLSLVDGTLARANKRLGPYLPDWMFTRAMFAIAFGAVIFMVVLPGLVSTFLLVAGALMVLFGAVVYSDPMFASKWLPGRTTPQHALLFGVAILMMGVLLGVIAK